MKIYFAADHAGFELKKKLIEFVRGLNYEAVDLGPDSADPDDDYPVIIERATMEVSKDGDKAIILGRSGQGEAIVANRFPNVRAVVFYGGNPEIITLSRAHNDSNVLSLGAGFLSEDDAKNAVKLWLESEFSGESRHMRRLREIDQLEESLYIKP
jgi:ribose 5-phosphate isomerase B